MTKNKIIPLIASAAASCCYGSNLGSVVNSWNGTYEEPFNTYLPTGVEYGGGYVWLNYYNFYAQCDPATGSVIRTIKPADPPGYDMGYEDATGYLYVATGGPYITVRESGTGPRGGQQRRERRE